jgi:ribonuclease BN (tRNA processing enzyme)
MTRFDQSSGGEGDLQVYGPPPIRDLTDGIWSPERGVFRYDVVARINHPMSIAAYRSRGGRGARPAPVVDVHEYAAGTVATGADWSCTAREVKHAQPYLACYGFRFETAQGVVAFSGDTAPTEAVVELAREADLCVMEAVHREDKLAAYATVSSESGTLGAGRMAAAAGARRLVINHQAVSLDPPEETTQAIAEVKSVYRGPVYWGRDMMDVTW